MAKFVGGKSGGGTPGPISNPEVKSTSADGSLGIAHARVGHRQRSFSTSLLCYISGASLNERPRRLLRAFCLSCSTLKQVSRGTICVVNYVTDSRISTPILSEEPRLKNRWTRITLRVTRQRLFAARNHRSTMLPSQTRSPIERVWFFVPKTGAPH